MKKFTFINLGIATVSAVLCICATFTFDWFDADVVEIHMIENARVIWEIIAEASTLFVIFLIMFFVPFIFPTNSFEFKTSNVFVAFIVMLPAVYLAWFASLLNGLILPLAYHVFVLYLLMEAYLFLLLHRVPSRKEVAHT